jgi:hypothetical protein
MADSAQLALVHAEIDGELDDRQRAELARCLLADPGFRATRDELRRLCGRLDSVEQVDPPADLLDGILASLPQAKTPMARFRVPLGGWRFAAMLAGVLVTGTIVYKITDGQGTNAAEMAGTLAGPRASQSVDLASISRGAVAGNASLIRRGSALGLALELTAGAPVDLLVASGKHSFTIKALSAGRTETTLPGFEDTGQPVNLTFMAGGREIGRASLE